MSNVAPLFGERHARCSAWHHPYCIYQSHGICNLTCRCKDALEELCAAKGLGSIDVAAFTDIKEPVEDLVKWEIEREEWFNPLLSSLKPAEEKSAPSKPEGKQSNTGVRIVYLAIIALPTNGRCRSKNLKSILDHQPIWCPQY